MFLKACILSLLLIHFVQPRAIINSYGSELMDYKDLEKYPLGPTLCDSWKDYYNCTLSSCNSNYSPYLFESCKKWDDGRGDALTL